MVQVVQRLLIRLRFTTRLIRAPMWSTRVIQILKTPLHGLVALLLLEYMHLFL